MLHYNHRILQEELAVKVRGLVYRCDRAWVRVTPKNYRPQMGRVMNLLNAAMTRALNEQSPGSLQELYDILQVRLALLKKIRSLYGNRGSIAEEVTLDSLRDFIAIAARRHDARMMHKSFSAQESTKSDGKRSETSWIISDADGRVLIMHDPLSRVIEYEYDAEGNRIVERWLNAPAGADPLKGWNRKGYYDTQVIWVIVYRYHRSGKTTTWDSRSYTGFGTINTDWRYEGTV